MLVIDDGGNHLGIIGNILNDGSIPTIIKVDGNDTGSCFMIQNFVDIPNIFCLEIPLLADSVKNTKWEEANKEISLIIIPTLALLSYGANIKPTVLDDNFIEEMQQLSIEHGFWAKIMVNVHEQYASDFVTSLVIKNLTIVSMTSTRQDPCQAATKGFRDSVHMISGQIVDTSRPPKKHEREQNSVKDFFIKTQLMYMSK
jgi:hypothetical protein